MFSLQKGESLDDVVHHRLYEELGIDCSLSEVSSFVYRTVFEKGVTEYEYDHVFVGEYNGSIKNNCEETSRVK